MEFIISKFFNKIHMINKWLISNGFLFKRYIEIGIIILAPFCFFYNYFNEEHMLSKLSIYIGGYILSLVLLIHYLNHGNAKKNITPIELFSEFSHRSFLYFVSTNSIILTFCLSMVIVSTIHLFDINITSEKLLYILYNLMMITSLLFLIIWFTYHYLEKKVDIDDINEYLKLYIAIHATIQLILLWFSFNNRLVMNYLVLYGVCFLWLQYIMAKIKNDRKN